MRTLVEEELVLDELQERRALVARIAASSHFHRSARLRDFLLYIGTQSLKDGCPEIHEQEVGARVFGRPLNYDRSQDNIVRVNATELRKRIEAYFATEGLHEPLIMEVPRGGYRAIFHRRELAVSAPVTVEPELPVEIVQVPQVAPAVPAKSNRRVNAIWASICTLLVIACAVLLQQNRIMRKASTPWQGKPALAALWSDFLIDHQQTDIVLSDDSFSVIQDLTHQPSTLEGYLDREYMREIQSSNLSADRKQDLDQIFGHNLVTFGGVRAAQQMLAQMPESPAPHLTLARFYAADAMKKDNIVLVGGKKANPWVHFFDGQLNFVTDYDYVENHAIVTNLHPRPGEPAVYSVSHSPNSFVGYSVVAYLPSPSGTGKAFVLAGTDSDATSAAAEFLTSEDSLENFRDILHVQKFPYFEVLLRTSRLGGTSFKSDVLAYRIYPNLH